MFKDRCSGRGDCFNQEPAMNHDRARIDHRAPDPRHDYASPEGLADDAQLDQAQREALLAEWKYEVEQRLKAIAEGMDTGEATDPSGHALLSAELRRVSHVHDAVAGRNG
jgi:hypothetical protein